MLAKINSCAVIGLDGALVNVEVDISGGQVLFLVVGLPDAAVSESRERVRAAIKNSGLNFPIKRITVNLAPADLRKEGPAYDLPIAVGVLVASEQITADVTNALIIGELSLDGAVRHTNGVLSMALLARDLGIKTLFVPASDAPEAALIPDIDVIPIESLFALYAHLQGFQIIPPFRSELKYDPDDAPPYPVDYSEVRGQEHVKRALEVAASGQHNLLMVGPPGAGKTIFVMQAARNIAASGDAIACVVCFEHSEVYLYQRLLCMESALGGNIEEAITLKEIRAVMEDELASLETLLTRSASARDAWSCFIAYWERLYLVKGHPSKTTLNVLDTYLSHLKTRSDRVVLLVDYLQKVPVPFTGVELTPERQIRIVTEGLKNLALAHHVPIVAVAASDAEGLKNERVRFQDMWGGASVQYEPDVAVMLNRGDENKILFSVEKNRLGPADIDLPYGLSGRHFAFDVREETLTSVGELHERTTAV